jgi:hypothetical protein
MNHLFVYEGGRFTPGDPLGLDSAEDYQEALQKQGYLLSQDVGENCSLSYTLFEHEDDGWVVLFRTFGRCAWILCRDWPDLIDLLHKLSTIALAGVLSHSDQDGRDAPCHMPIGPVKPFPPRRKAL